MLGPEAVSELVDKRQVGLLVLSLMLVVEQSDKASVLQKVRAKDASKAGHIKSQNRQTFVGLHTVPMWASPAVPLWKSL